MNKIYCVSFDYDDILPYTKGNKSTMQTHVCLILLLRLIVDLRRVCSISLSDSKKTKQNFFKLVNDYKIIKRLNMSRK